MRGTNAHTEHTTTTTTQPRTQAGPSLHPSRITHSKTRCLQEHETTMVLNEMDNTDVSTVQFRKAAIQRRSSKTIFDEGEADASEVEVVVDDDAPEEDTREYLDW